MENYNFISQYNSKNFINGNEQNLALDFTSSPYPIQKIITNEGKIISESVIPMFFRINLGNNKYWFNQDGSMSNFYFETNRYKKLNNWLFKQKSDVSYALNEAKIFIEVNSDKKSSQSFNLDKLDFKLEINRKQDFYFYKPSIWIENYVNTNLLLKTKANKIDYRIIIPNNPYFNCSTGSVIINNNKNIYQDTSKNIHIGTLLSHVNYETENNLFNQNQVIAEKQLIFHNGIIKENYLEELFYFEIKEYWNTEQLKLFPKERSMHLIDRINSNLNFNNISTPNQLTIESSLHSYSFKHMDCIFYYDLNSGLLKNNILSNSLFTGDKVILGGPHKGLAIDWRYYGEKLEIITSLNIFNNTEIITSYKNQNYLSDEDINISTIDNVGEFINTGDGDTNLIFNYQNVWKYANISFELKDWIWIKKDFVYYEKL